jgi:hypothetical protein
MAGEVRGAAAVKRSPTEQIVEFLSFATDIESCANQLRKVGLRDWDRALQWLNDAGLAFYILQKLKSADVVDAVPADVISRLENDFTANQQRVSTMSRRFGLINQMFNDAGVRYAVLKGVSLVPQFCPDAFLRYQADFDYLVDEAWLSTARRLLFEVGYIPKPSSSSQEFIFLMPGMGKPSRRSEYSARAAHAVELHLDIWDRDLDRVSSIPPLFSVERIRTQQWNEFAFPALDDEDSFLLQVLHACHHFFSYWIRMSCLFEIGYFLNRRASDASLWNRIEQRVGDSFVLREFVVVVTELAAKLFASPLPPLVRDWGARIRPGPRVWIESYARPWAFCDLPVYQFRLFPTAKLVRFLHQQYRDGASAQKALVRDLLLPSWRISRIASSVRDNPSLVLDVAWWKRQRLVPRSLFYVLGWLRYLCEIPRWRWLNRAHVRSNMSISPKALNDATSAR